MPRYRNRIDAGRRLASHLAELARRSDVLVLGLPRGGAPGHRECATGAIAAGAIEVLSHDVIDTLRIPRALVVQAALCERIELDRRDDVLRPAGEFFVDRDAVPGQVLSCLPGPQSTTGTPIAPAAVR
jgi:putative phosphoribosyl transferase